MKKEEPLPLLQNRPKTRLQKEAHVELLELQMEFQDFLKHHWVERSLPQEWEHLDSTAPVEPHKTKVTLRLDEDMLKWFRKLGAGYQARINQVLRIYWLALRAGKIARHYDEFKAGPPM